MAIIFGPISRVPKRRDVLADRQAIGHPCSPVWSACREWKNKEEITINVPLFKKLRDIILFWWENHFMSHFEGHFEGAKTFLTP